MPSLKSLRDRINSVKATRKITAAMKTVAASKMRRAQAQAAAARPYAERMEQIMRSVASRIEGLEEMENLPLLLKGREENKTHLLILLTSDRGLCGQFNSQLVREKRRLKARLTAAGQQVKILCIGRKGADMVRRTSPREIVGVMTDVGRPRLTFNDAMLIADRVQAMFEAGEFDVCTLVYNKFKNAMTQVPITQQIIPVSIPQPTADAATSLTEYEPNAEVILNDLLPRNLRVQIYRALLESNAGEQSARMVAMDNATRNAGDMINNLTLTYNRSRQDFITKELIEIISGAEAV